MACKCTATLRWLCAHGAPHACVQHQSGRKENGWTVSDWLTHFDEEERLFCPYLPAKVANKIRADHVRFRAQLAATGKVDAAEMAEHAGLEDQWADEFLKRKR